MKSPWRTCIPTNRTGFPGQMPKHSFVALRKMSWAEFCRYVLNVNSFRTRSCRDKKYLYDWNQPNMRTSPGGKDTPKLGIYVFGISSITQGRLSTSPSTVRKDESKVGILICWNIWLRLVSLIMYAGLPVASLTDKSKAYSNITFPRRSIVER